MLALARRAAAERAGKRASLAWKYLRWLFRPFRACIGKFPLAGGRPLRTPGCSGSATSKRRPRRKLVLILVFFPFLLKKIAIGDD